MHIPRLTEVFILAERAQTIGDLARQNAPIEVILLSFSAQLKKYKETASLSPKIDDVIMNGKLGEIDFEELANKRTEIWAARNNLDIGDDTEIIRLQSAASNLSVFINLHHHGSTTSVKRLFSDYGEGRFFSVYGEEPSIVRSNPGETVPPWSKPVALNIRGQDVPNIFVAGQYIIKKSGHSVTGVWVADAVSRDKKAPTDIRIAADSVLEKNPGRQAKGKDNLKRWSKSKNTDSDFRSAARLLYNHFPKTLSEYTAIIKPHAQRALGNEWESSMESGYGIKDAGDKFIKSCYNAFYSAHETLSELAMALDLVMQGELETYPDFDIRSRQRRPKEDMIRDPVTENHGTASRNTHMMSKKDFDDLSKHGPVEWF